MDWKLSAIQIFHVVLCVFALIAPYITDNRTYLSLFIVYYVSIVTLWHVHGNCCITDLENKWGGNKDTTPSYVFELTSKVLGDDTNTVFSFVPLVNTIVCLYKINY
jgi:hypothetical protein